MTLGIPNPSEFRKLLNKLDGRYESNLSESEIVSIRPIAIVGSLSAWANNGADMPFEPEQAKGHRPKYPKVEFDSKEEGIEVPELFAPFSEKEIHSMIAMAEERGATMEQFFQIAEELGSTGVCEFLELDEGAFGRVLGGAALGGVVGGPVGALAGAGLAMMRPIKTAHSVLKLGQAYHAYGTSKEQHRAAKVKAQLTTLKATQKLNKRRDTEVVPAAKVKKIKGGAEAPVVGKIRAPRRAKDVLARLERMKASKAARATTLPGIAALAPQAAAIPGTVPFSRGGSSGGVTVPRATSRSRSRSQTVVGLKPRSVRAGSVP